MGGMTHLGLPPVPCQQVRRSAFRPHHILLGLALVLTFFAYIGASKFEFVYDDHEQIIENRFIHSWRYLPTYFTGHVWSHRDPAEQGNYYRPLFLFWLRLNHLAFGLAPSGWHVSTLLVHLLVVLLVYFLARRLVADPWSAAVASLIFGLHPVHAESVAWVSGVTDPLLAVPFIASLLFYLKANAATSRQLAWRGWSLASFALALLAKETALVLPLLVFGYAWLSTPETHITDLTWGARARRALQQVSPYLLLCGIYLVVRALALRGLSHPPNPLPISTLLFTAPSLLWFYLRQLAWPTRLSAFYDAAYVMQPTLRGFILPGLGLLGLATGAWWWSKKSRPAALGAVWLLAPLLPVLNIQVFNPGDIAHDRYLYLPSIGFALLLAVAVQRLRIGRATVWGRPVAQVAVAVTLAGVLMLVTLRQSVYWANDLLLSHHSLRIVPNSIDLKINLANALAERGAQEEAIHLYREVLTRKPDLWMAHFNLGYLYYQQRQLAQAEHHLGEAATLNRNDPRSFLYLGLVWLRTGRLPEAAAAIREAIRIRPDGPDYHFALGIVLKTQGDLQSALEALQRELLINPGHSDARSQVAELESCLRNADCESRTAIGPPALR